MLSSYESNKCSHTLSQMFFLSFIFTKTFQREDLLWKCVKTYVQWGKARFNCCKHFCIRKGELNIGLLKFCSKMLVPGFDYYLWRNLGKKLVGNICKTRVACLCQTYWKCSRRIRNPDIYSFWVFFLWLIKKQPAAICSFFYSTSIE